MCDHIYGVHPRCDRCADPLPPSLVRRDMAILRATITAQQTNEAIRPTRTRCYRRRAAPEYPVEHCG